MKILNLYAGIGGNRKLWGDEHEVTAVELDPDIAKIYQNFFPNDKMVVADAHKYLLDHFKEFDFIWSSPPCPTHSRIRHIGVLGNVYTPKFPDMKLYEEIILLQHFAPKNVKWVVENVKPYYNPLIPAKQIHRHLFWTNFDITHRDIIDDKRKHRQIHAGSTIYGINLGKYNIPHKRKILRNMVNPEVGLHILNEAMNVKATNFKQNAMF